MSTMRTWAAIGAIGAMTSIAPLRADSGVDRVLATIDSAGPGCVAGVQVGDAAPAFGAAGRADLEHAVPIGVESVFEAGSVSKQFTAAAVAVLASEGRLSLDADIRRYLPELPAYAVSIRVRQLLQHTAGLRDYGDLADLAGRPRGRYAYTMTEVLALLARQRRTNAPPGTEYLYSNSHYVLTALIVERVSGRSLAAFTRSALFEPIGMRHSTWRGDFAAVVPGRATAYTPDAAGRMRQDMPFEDVVGHAGLLTTVPDLLAWNRALAAPTPQQAPWVALLHARGALADGLPIDYALGLELSEPGAPPRYTHAGATAGYRAFLGRDPATRTSVALLCNAGAIDSQALGPQLADAFRVEPAVAPAIAPAPPDRTGSAPPVGRYRIRASGVPVTIEADREGLRTGGSVYRPYGPDRWLRSDGRRTLGVERAQPDRVQLRLTRPGNADQLLDPVADWTPSAAALAGFVGRYRSAEVDAMQTVAVDGRGLTVTGPDLAVLHATPVYADTFGTDGGWLIAFRRDAGGRVEGFEASRPRTRGVAFERVSAPR